MQTKMDVFITITPRVKSLELYGELRPFRVNVTDVGDKVFVTAKIDIREDTLEYIINTCKEYGDIPIKAHMAEEPSS